MGTHATGDARVLAGAVSATWTVAGRSGRERDRRVLLVRYPRRRGLLKQLGVGLASAILIDATLVRAVLLPATMKLLGDRNWYLPGWLAWLPRLSHEHSATAC